MITMASISELHNAGTVLDSDEAVAITQQLISMLHIRRFIDEGRPPYSAPSARNVYLNEDGSVSCRGCTTTPTVSEVGIFLHDLLPVGSLHVTEGLRHTIASALFHVNLDLASFDPLEELSRELVQHEHGDRADVVRNVLARCAV